MYNPDFFTLLKISKQEIHEVDCSLFTKICSSFGHTAKLYFPASFAFRCGHVTDLSLMECKPKQCVPSPGKPQILQCFFFLLAS